VNKCADLVNEDFSLEQEEEGQMSNRKKKLNRMSNRKKRPNRKKGPTQKRATGRDAEIAKWVAGVVEALKAIPEPPAPTPEDLARAQEEVVRALHSDDPGLIQISPGMEEFYFGLIDPDDVA